MRGSPPKAALVALDAGDPVRCEQIIRKVMETSTGLRWAITQGVWSFGASGIIDFIEKTKLATMEGIAEQIKCPCLVLEGEADMFFLNQHQKFTMRWYRRIH